MAIFNFKKNGGTTLAVCLVLLFFVAWAGADDKKKDKGNNSSSHSNNRSSRASSHTSRHESNSGSRGQGQNQGRRVGQSNNSQGSGPVQTYKEPKQPKFNKSRGDKDDRAGNDHNTTFKSGGPNHGSEVRDRNHGAEVRDTKFADRDRRGNDFRGGPGQSHVVREAPRTVREVHGRQVAFDRGGHVREIHARNMEIHRDLRGQRTFVTERHGVRYVSVGDHHGYMERRYISRGNRVYVQRTYVVGGVTYARAYRTYSWHGAVYYHYAPAYYYRPGFYAWAYNPWPRPVAYRWGWFGDPWYPAYGYYFAPYPVYPTAALWLTDFLIAENLRLAYENRQLAAANQQYQQDAAAAQQYQQAPQDQQNYQQSPDPQNANQVQLSPEVKQMIADEVQRQLEAEKAASASQNQQAAPANEQGGNGQGEEVPAALDPNHRVFVVASNLDVVGQDGSECTLTAGDVILRTSNDPDGSKVAVNVITSKQGDCASNTNTAVEVSDLQEMQNKFREQLDSGMKRLADNQGKDGLPQAPDTGTVNGEVPAPTPDANAQKELDNEQKAADGVEGSVKTARNPQEN